ncbi:DUF2256 domain-containing protein [Robiginitalea biformata]|uniref:DUF2256 domain-containing protein n=1 Tax=Robiginitalea biformata TaxID=252307 RepID=UPI003B5955BC
MRSKTTLPEKLCPVCLRPFSWRKKWQRHWESVRYCSTRCRNNRGRVNGSQGRIGAGNGSQGRVGAGNGSTSGINPGREIRTQKTMKR